MTMKTIKICSFLSALIIAAPTLPAQEPLEDRINLLLPSAEEDRFLEIAWRTDLLKARAEANELGKPMFMWMMNGHPFGAT